MKKLYWVFLFLLLNNLLFSQQKFTLSGYVTDELGEELIGANILLVNQNKGAISNTYGFYSLTLPAGNYKVEFSFVGYESQVFDINLNSGKHQNVALIESSEMIQTVDVFAEGKDANVREVEMSTNTLQMKTIQKLPMLMGETDVIKTIQLLPGVMQSNEASGGFHVRGGGTDQNLILLDNATVYNASHMVGFMSVFNSDAIKDIKLYKGGIPAEYGGRMSSVLDIHMKEGNKQEFHGSGGIGTIASKLTIEGPIIEDKMSFIFSGRRTYADLFIPFAKDSLAKESDIYFYDLNAKVNYNINDNNRVFLSGYFGRDVLKFGDMMNMDYGNFTITARWNHVFNNRLFLNTSSIYSNYSYDMGVTEDVMKVDWSSYIHDLNQQLDFTYYLNPDNTIQFGAQVIKHNFSLGEVNGQLDDTTEFLTKIPNTRSMEYAIYISNEQNFTPRLTVQYGLRYSFFQNIGNGQSMVFDRTDPRQYVATDTLHYQFGEIFNGYYNGFEPRMSVRYKLDMNSSLKASYNRIFQYVQLASNSTASLPVDYWIPSSPNIKPQLADQIAAGYFRNFKENTYETSVELFYKWTQHTVDFRDHANLMLNDAFEGEIREGKGWAYGAEFMIKKQEGKLTGWISYTYSRAFKKIPEINQGKTYQASYDKPHNLAIVVSYDINERLNLSGNYIYISAQPRTMPTGRFEYGGIPAPVYSERNSIRIFPYHRLDVACNYRLNKSKKRFEPYINFSIYNVYMKKNPIMISFEPDRENPRITRSYMTYLYRIVPSITFSCKF
jgi:hypothetical protein